MGTTVYTLTNCDFTPIGWDVTSLIIIAISLGKREAESEVLCLYIHIYTVLVTCSLIKVEFSQ